MNTVNQKEYLRKYLSLGNEPGKKKKRKKKSTTSDRVKIIDDDIDIATFNRAVEEDLHAQNEDAPQIVGVIDDRPLELRIGDYRDSDLWKPIGTEGNEAVTPSFEKPSEIIGDETRTVTIQYDEDYSPARRQTDRYYNPSPPMIESNESISAKSDKGFRSSTGKGTRSKEGLSPARQRDRSISPYQRRKSERRNSDASPPRRTRKDSDPSPNRRSWKDISPTNTNPTRRSRRDSDTSPPRRNRSDNFVSPIRKGKSPIARYKSGGDISPTRRNRRETDTSPFRRNRRDNDSNPSRRNRRSSDVSPQRRNKRDNDPSPSRRNRRSSDASPTRRNRRDNDAGSPRRNRKDREVSPKDGGGDRSPSRRSKFDRNISPPRRDRKDRSPSRNSRRDEDFSRAGTSGGSKDGRSQSREYNVENRVSKSDDGKYRSERTDKNRSEKPSTSSSEKDSQEQSAVASRIKALGKSRWDQESPSRTSPEPQLIPFYIPKKSGLQRANDIIMGKDPTFQPSGDFASLAGFSGGNAAPIVRDRKTGKIRDLKAEDEEAKKKREREDEIKAKYAKWGKGMKQVEDASEKLNSDLHEMNKPLARYADDEDLEKHLKEMERDGDPMLQYLRKKRKKQDVETGKPVKPEFLGEFMPNRYGIRPGHRWDGVDRSNGYEKKWFEVMNSRRAEQEEAYKWSTEDM